MDPDSDTPNPPPGSDIAGGIATILFLILVAAIVIVRQSYYK